MAFRLATPRATSRLVVGHAVGGGAPVEIPRDLLATGLHVIGPTGSGKSRFLLNLIAQIAPDPNAATIICSGKGSFGAQAQAVCLSAGLARRLLVLDPGDRERVVGFNPLRPISGVDPESQVAGCREAIRSAWNQRSLVETPQLARFLHLALAVARDQELTLLEAAEMLRPQSKLREALIPRVRDAFTREALAYLETLREQRIDELTASTVARLEGFISDSRLRTIFTQQGRGLDLGKVIANRQVLVVDLRLNDPLRLDQVRLVGRLLIADLVAQIFARPEGSRHPVNLVIDEAALYLAPDLIEALDQGRELGMRTVLAHQYPEQLVHEDESRRIYEAVLNDARTRVLFGGLNVAALRPLVEDMFIGEVDPFRIKDEISALECEPVETTRVSRTRSRSGSEGESVAYPRSESEQESASVTNGRSRSRGVGRNVATTASEAAGWSESRGEQRAKAVANGTAHTRAVARGVANGVAFTNAHGSARISGAGNATSSLSSDALGVSLLPTGEVVNTVNAATAAGVGSSAMESVAEQESHAETVSSLVTETASEAFSQQRIETESRAVSRERGTNGSRSRGQTFGVTEQRDEAESTAVTRGGGRSRSSGVTPTFSRENGWSESESVQPFHAYRKRWRVNARTFMPSDEQLLRMLQKVKGQQRGHFVMKTPENPPVFARTPYVEVPRISARGQMAFREHLAGLPFYAEQKEIEAEADARRERLLLEAPSTPTAAKRRASRRLVRVRDF
jgi:hypothetical protein